MGAGRGRGTPKRVWISGGGGSPRAAASVEQYPADRQVQRACVGERGGERETELLKVMRALIGT